MANRTDSLWTLKEQEVIKKTIADLRKEHKILMQVIREMQKALSNVAKLAKKASRRNWPQAL